RQRSGSRVSSWGAVSDAELNLFLEFVGLTRVDGSPPAQDRTRTGTTADGRWRVVLEPPDPATAVATLVSDQGRLVTVDWRFHLGPACTLRRDVTCSARSPGCCVARWSTPAPSPSCGRWCGTRDAARC